MTRKRISNLASAFVLFVSLGSLNTYAQPTPTPTHYRLSVADMNVALDLVLPTISQSAVQRNAQIPAAFVDPIESFSEKGDAARLWAVKLTKNPVGADWLTIVVEPAAQVLSPPDFRAFALKKFTKNARGIKYLDHHGIPLARYSTDNLAAPMILDAKPTNRNLEAFLANENMWVRIKFTAGSLGAEEERLFFSVMESAKFVDTSHPSSSFDYYSLGRAFSAKKDFRQAAENFTSALKLERIHQQLSPNYWYDLIMQSADVYVATSDLAAAVAVLEYGVTRAPANTTLLMQLARTYSWLGDKEKTIETLKTTFSYMKQEKKVFEETRIPGGGARSMSLPDLNKDPAFKEMMKDKAFRDAVKMITK